MTKNASFLPSLFDYFSALVSSLMKDYFFKPPINKISLHFLEIPLEKAYRSSYKEEVHKNAHIFAHLFHDPTCDCDFNTLHCLTLSLSKNSARQKRGLMKCDLYLIL